MKKLLILPVLFSVLFLGGCSGYYSQDQVSQLIQQQTAANQAEISVLSQQVSTLQNTINNLAQKVSPIASSSAPTAVNNQAPAAASSTVSASAVNNISTKFNKNRVFILQKSELEKRFDPPYYIPDLLELEKKVLAKKPKKLRDYVLSLSSGATPKTTEIEKYYSEKENGIRLAAKAIFRPFWGISNDIYASRNAPLSGVMINLLIRIV